MSKKIMSLLEASQLIAAGERLLIAGDAALLAQLPRGSWIGGSIPYFMGDSGGLTDREVLYVDVLPPEVEDVCIRTYAPDTLRTLPTDGFDGGFSVIILPAMSPIHLAFAQDGPDVPGIYDRPLVGWVAGVHLADLGQAAPVVAIGPEGRLSTTEAVVLHARLPANKAAALDIVNLFVQGEGDALTFGATGFSHGEVLVNGEPRNFARYLKDIGHDVRMPLVADYFGAMINVSFQSVADEDARVDVYAPVFEGVTYKLVAPVEDYVGEFERRVPHGSLQPVFACNCILNFLYSNLEGQRTGDLRGPITFGEIAYQLLNQTLVYLQLQDLDGPSA